MIRFILSTILLVAFLSSTQAQNNETCRQVIGAAGKYSQNGARYYAYTVGEVVVFTGASANARITQGFHQPELCALVSTQDITLNAWGIEVYPVPTDHFLNIRFSAEKEGHLIASVFDIMGRLQTGPLVLTDPAQSSIDCSSWQPGVYFLRLKASDSNAVSTIRFIRI